MGQQPASAQSWDNSSHQEFFDYYAKESLTTYNVWPIPSSEIERNKDAVLTQNPGY